MTLKSVTITKWMPSPLHPSWKWFLYIIMHDCTSKEPARPSPLKNVPSPFEHVDGPFLPAREEMLTPVVHCTVWVVLVGKQLIL